ncbi:METTL5 family protein [Methanothermobacter tenebrarum]|uniref:RNA methyltransferase n=1 Tax=Methanothermobacter tenebrarum TaxID=680118 RepID=A0A328PF99_9EURY|nr:METTL5 family protein [Methanothermobacter tenebrarum]MBC7100504.1 methyltransferase [Methanobacteriales archaeon]MBC7117819.1 methyltransferase [Methanobacteriaceae archaeon]NPV64243.1 methyltransferase [Methanobacteriaceae archaeon]RAO79981.1 RNA methyltransferase [Methanothermobacter tenebrarum]
MEYRILKKRHLEILLEKVPDYASPKAGLEQYKTPSAIAADILWFAYNLGDIHGKHVMDLACGTGIFAIGAAILGAGKVFAVDIDKEALEVAVGAAEELGVADRIQFIEADIRDSIMELSRLKVDTLIQNPPFGSQRMVKRGADRIFIEGSLRISPVVYSFHMMGSEDFVTGYFERIGGKITHKLYYRFPIPRIYNFHKKDFKVVDVIVLRIIRT